MHWQIVGILLDRDDIDGMVALWRESFYLGEYGKEVRNRITEKQLVLEERFNIAHNTFRQFVEMHDSHHINLSDQKALVEKINSQRSGYMRNVCLKALPRFTFAEPTLFVALFCRAETETDRCNVLARNGLLAKSERLCLSTYPGGYDELDHFCTVNLRNKDLPSYLYLRLCLDSNYYYNHAFIKFCLTTDKVIVGDVDIIGKSLRLFPYKKYYNRLTEAIVEYLDHHHMTDERWDIYWKNFLPHLLRVEEYLGPRWKRNLAYCLHDKEGSEKGLKLLKKYCPENITRTRVQIHFENIVRIRDY